MPRQQKNNLANAVATKEHCRGNKRTLPWLTKEHCHGNKRKLPQKQKNTAVATKNTTVARQFCQQRSDKSVTIPAKLFDYNQPARGAATAAVQQAESKLFLV